MPAVPQLKGKVRVQRDDLCTCLSSAPWALALRLRHCVSCDVPLCIERADPAAWWPSALLPRSKSEVRVRTLSRLACRVVCTSH